MYKGCPVSTYSGENLLVRKLRTISASEVSGVPGRLYKRFDPGFHGFENLKVTSKIPLAVLCTEYASIFRTGQRSLS